MASMLCHLVCFSDFRLIFLMQSNRRDLPRSVASLTNDDIEAVIQMATSSRPSPDGRSVPLKDTRTQLFVGNVRVILSNSS